MLFLVEKHVVIVFNMITDPTRPFFIGTINQKDYWTNIALDHERGILTNETLMKMTDEQLRNLWINSNDEVILEEYRRPDNEKIAEKQGGFRNEIYIGVHRAKIILDYREEKKKKNYD